ncbi:MAG: hypothetical protein ABEN55_11295 [Bradymonadaceae bacterium]
MTKTPLDDMGGATVADVAQAHDVSITRVFKALETCRGRNPFNRDASGYGWMRERKVRDVESQLRRWDKLVELDLVDDRLK